MHTFEMQIQNHMNVTLICHRKQAHMYLYNFKYNFTGALLQLFPLKLFFVVFRFAIQNGHWKKVEQICVLFDS